MVEQARRRLGLGKDEDLPDDVELETWDTYSASAQPSWAQTQSRQLTGAELATLEQRWNDEQFLPAYLGDLLLAELNPKDLSGTPDGQSTVTEAEVGEPDHLWVAP